jgi:hypothetical protein
VLVRLVTHGRKRSRNLTRFHADDVKAGLSQAIGQVLGQRARLKTDLVDRFTELAEAAD